MNHKKRRTQNTYFIFLEGETEKWYFEHLKFLINTCEERSNDVEFIYSPEIEPIKAIRSISSPYRMGCFEIFDFEGTTDNDKSHFESIIKQYKTVKREYKDFHLGYSNLTFELWMILHRKCIFSYMAGKKLYLKEINKAFTKNFQSLAEYKRERNFKKILNDYIHLEEIQVAIENAERIRARKKESGATLVNVAKFQYYFDNPDCTIQECVKQILKECGII